MDAVRRREPRLERTVARLADEHRQLLLALDAVIAQAQSPAHPEGQLRALARQWIGNVRWHESQEEALLQETFNDDIGAED